MAQRIYSLRQCLSYMLPVAMTIALPATAIFCGTAAAQQTAVDADEKVEAESTVERFDKIVREDIFAGFSGDADAMKRGLAKCEEFLAKDAKFAEALVWRGAGRVFQAGEAFAKQKPIDGFRLWSSGLADMDQAVELEPKNLAVRIPRAAVLMPASANAPAAMAAPLLQKAREDFELIYEIQANVIAELGEHPNGELRMGLADVYRRLGETEKSKQQLQAIGTELPNTEYSERAKEWLAAAPTAKLTHSCLGCHDE